MIRIAVTGSKGQVAASLLERAAGDVEIVALGRPVFALEDRCAVVEGITAARPDVVINAAARLDNARLRRVYGLALPEWRGSLSACCARLIGHPSEMSCRAKSL